MLKKEPIKMKQFITTQIGDFRNFIKTLLPDPSSVKQYNAACTFLMYDNIIRPNFIFWLMLMQHRAITQKAKEVIQDNLDCEIRENHPQMLLNFTAHFSRLIKDKQEDSSPLLRLYTKVDQATVPILPNIRNLTAQCYGHGNSNNYIGGVFLMALLENGSLEFIPWMETVAERTLGGDLTYFRVHGQADIQHANDFVEAVIKEAENCRDQHRNIAWERNLEKDMKNVLNDTKIIFKEIFSFVN